jgi:hypothetical protein
MGAPLILHGFFCRSIIKRVFGFVKMRYRGLAKRAGGASRGALIASIRLRHE